MLPLLLWLVAQTYCDESPMHDPSLQSISYGRVTNGALLGAVRVRDVHVLPLHHTERCLVWTTPRLAEALAEVSHRLGEISVGNFSRAAGGVVAYSRSHQSGRDADIAFFQTTLAGAPSVPADLHPFAADLRSEEARFDVARNWQLVRALLENRRIDVEWLFIAEPLRAALLAYAASEGAAQSLLALAAERLHQPTDAPPHDDHLHLRIRCTEEERRRGCVD